eukprot:545244-Prorocentrum_minimum.AAC.1
MTWHTHPIVCLRRNRLPLGFPAPDWSPDWWTACFGRGRRRAFCRAWGSDSCPGQARAGRRRRAAATRARRRASCKVWGSAFCRGRGRRRTPAVTGAPPPPHPPPRCV